MITGGYDYQVRQKILYLFQKLGRARYVTLLSFTAVYKGNDLDKLSNICRYQTYVYKSTLHISVYYINTFLYLDFYKSDNLCVHVKYVM